MLKQLTLEQLHELPPVPDWLEKFCSTYELVYIGILPKLPRADNDEPIEDPIDLQKTQEDCKIRDIWDYAVSQQNSNLWMVPIDNQVCPAGYHGLVPLKLFKEA